MTKPNTESLRYNLPLFTKNKRQYLFQIERLTKILS